MCRDSCVSQCGTDGDCSAAQHHCRSYVALPCRLLSVLYPVNMLRGSVEQVLKRLCVVRGIPLKASQDGQTVVR